jgi:hypothetical protein
VGRHLEAESESVEILLLVVDIRVPVIVLPVRSELLLHEHAQARSHLGGDDLGGFGVQVAARALKMVGKEDDVSPKVLVD